MKNSIVDLPWPLVIAIVVLITYFASGRKTQTTVLVAFCTFFLGFLSPRYWDKCIMTTCIVIIGMLLCIVIGIPVGIAMARNKKVRNAWCMPGGKIAVYSGILEVINNNNNGLAVIMGHEIAHAVAKHSVERASRNVLLNVGTQIVDIASGGKLSTINRTTGMNTVGLLSQLGITNPFNRKQESEADYLGLIFSSLAGYDIRQAINVWENMQKLNKGKEPPEFLSTHPSTKNRIKSLKRWIDEIILEYPPIKKIN